MMMRTSVKDIAGKVISGIVLGTFGFALGVQAGAARVTLEPTGPSHAARGSVVLTETEDGLSILAQVGDAPPGRHGFHIHENGSCSNAGEAAGGHFNPDKLPHGELSQDGLAGAHAGDLGNIEIGEDGKGVLEKTVKGLTLGEGKYAIQGRAVVLHEKADDFGQPSGNAGARIACGVIEPE